MDSDPTVVVALPTYNNEDTIGSTLEMVFGQAPRPTGWSSVTGAPTAPGR